MEQKQKTELYDLHLQHSGKMVDFGGWQMPVSYGSVIDEHKHVREKVGAFDVSHMGEFRVCGSDALAYLQNLTINDVASLAPGQGQYTAMCNKDGGIVDDLILYCLNSEEFFLCVNAGNIAKDFSWCEKNAVGYKSLQLSNESASWSQIAIQGPSSLDALLEMFLVSEHGALNQLSYTEIVLTTYCDTPCYAARTGYTGEHGYEIYLPNHVVGKFWQDLLVLGGVGVKPVGLGARDTLRLEACYLLYGQDMNETLSPLEVGLSWATKLSKGDFIGRDQLAKQKSEGLKRKLCAFRMEESGIPRSGMPTLDADGNFGQVMSGSVLPTLGGSGGLALVNSSIKLGDHIEVDIRGKKKKALVVKKPFYKAKTKS